MRTIIYHPDTKQVVGAYDFTAVMPHYLEYESRLYNTGLNEEWDDIVSCPSRYCVSLNPSFRLVKSSATQ